MACTQCKLAAHYYRCSVVCVSVDLLVTTVSLAKTDEPIDMPFGLWTWVGRWSHVLDGGPDPHRKGGFWGVVPSSKCIRLCKQQTPQQHGAASLVGREQRITTKARLQNGRLSCCGGDKCSGGDATFRWNSLTTCYGMHMTSYLLLQFTLAILIISV